LGSRADLASQLPPRPVPDRGRDAGYPAPTGSPRAVARPRFPQNPACRFPAPGSSAVDLQHCECLQLPIGETQLRSQQRRPLLDLVEGFPCKVTTGPAAATQHPDPVTLRGAIHLHERPDISGDAVVGVVATQDGIDLADLVTDPIMPNLPHHLLQRHQAAPKARLLGAHPDPEVALPVTRAIERQAQKVDRLWAISAALARVSLREPAKLDQLGLGRLQSKAELTQPATQRVLHAQRIRSILETDHKVVDVAHQVGFAPQPALDHALEP
jgi:hypothetical protein